MKIPEELVDELYETIHFYDGDWEGLDCLPDQEDGKPGWDTPRSIDDDEGVPVPRIEES